MRIRAPDNVAELFIRRIGDVHNRAREELQSIQARQRELSDALVATLEDVLDSTQNALSPPPRLWPRLC